MTADPHLVVSIAASILFAAWLVFLFLVVQAEVMVRYTSRLVGRDPPAIFPGFVLTVASSVFSFSAMLVALAFV